MGELKPCKCGGTPVWESHESMVKLICLKCERTTGDVPYDRFAETTSQAKQDAIELWNRRQNG